MEILLNMLLPFGKSGPGADPNALTYVFGQFILYPGAIAIIFGIYLAILYFRKYPVELHATLGVVTLNCVVSIASMYEIITTLIGDALLYTFILSTLSLLSTIGLILFLLFQFNIARNNGMYVFVIFAIAPVIQTALFQINFGHLRFIA